MNELNVIKPIVVVHPSCNIRGFILEKNPLNVKNVVKLLLRASNLLYT